MKKFLSLFSVIAALALSHFAAADTLHGQVVGVADGDSITVLGLNKTHYKIRLAGIDSPEKAQAYGLKAKESLSNLVFGKSVDVEWRKQDRYGRLVGKILLDGMDVCLEQIKRGMAWHYKQYQKEQLGEDRDAYAQSETLARQEKIGLWSDPWPVEPSVFRRDK